MPGDNKKSCVLKLQVCLSMFDLLLPQDVIKGLITILRTITD